MTPTSAVPNVKKAPASQAFNSSTAQVRVLVVLTQNAYVHPAVSATKRHRICTTHQRTV
ncbi:MAG: hypothetical protein HKL83_00800 [Acidimicrobiaceae bacterium]|nr:hypothetical protein [Acidimicrobiaceae bacterium]